MELWVVVSLAGAGFQTVRFMLQKRMSLMGVSAAGATFARFVFAAPLMLMVLFLGVRLSDVALPEPPRIFWFWASLGALTQVLATLCVLTVFSMRHFAVGITLMKTEVLFTAVLGAVLLGDHIGAVGTGALLLGVFGVLLLSRHPGDVADLRKSIFNRATALGLLSGVIFAICSIAYRAATLALPSDNPVLRASLTLAIVLMMQLAGMGLWLALKRRGEISRVLRQWRRTIAIGTMSLAGSFCWFLAFTLQNAAYVKTVGQIELVFSFLVGRFVFGERVSRTEIIGSAVLCLSIVLLILLGG